MKKFLSTLLTLTLVFAMSINAFATENTTTTTSVEYLGDDLYLTETEVIIDNSSMSRASGTKTVTRTYTLSNSSGTKLAEFKLTGNFHYNGTRSSCLASSYETVLYSSSGKFTYTDCYCSGNSAIGEFTYKIYVLGINTKTVEQTKTISCDKDGNIS